MNDQEIIEKLDQLKTLSAQEKHVAMCAYLENERFLTAVRLATDTSITFGVSNVKKVSTTLVEDPLVYLEDLAKLNKGGATKVQKDMLNAIASQSPETFDLVQRIVRKTLGCGIGTKTIHEIAPRLIPYYPYMRCSGVEKLDKILRDGRAYSQLKDNGMYLDIFVDLAAWKVSYRTRNGNWLKMKLPIENEVLKNVQEACVLMGEATLYLNDNRDVIMPRAAGNAIISQAIDEDMPADIANRIKLNLWDMVPMIDYHQLHCPTPYDDRLAMVDEFICELPGSMLDRIDLIETREVRSEAGVWAHFRDVKSRPVQEGGEELEGLVVKHPRAVWKDGTSADQGKVKDVKECEMVCCDWTPGDPGSKYEGMIGSLKFQSSCGGIIVNVSGMDDALRARDPETLISTIWGVKFTKVCTKKGSDIASLENPRLSEPRLDKSQADDRAYIEQLKSIHLEEGK